MDGDPGGGPDLIKIGLKIESLIGNPVVRYIKIGAPNRACVNTIFKSAIEEDIVGVGGSI